MQSPQRRQVFAEWRADMARLAECDNVLVKIGGLNMDFTGLSFVGEARPSAVSPRLISFVSMPFLWRPVR